MQGFRVSADIDSTFQARRQSGRKLRQQRLQLLPQNSSVEHGELREMVEREKRMRKLTLVAQQSIASHRNKAPSEPQQNH